jgi:hypothetical protein
VRRAAALGLGLLGARRLRRLIASGALTIDTGVGRTVQPLGPVGFEISSPRDVVFDVIAAPYLRRTPRALEDKLAVWERGSDMVLAAHFTPVGSGVTTTVETVRFLRPDRIEFRVVRGPVPHLAEAFELSEFEGGTRLTWSGELGTDFWGIGAAWGKLVARHWEHAVRESLAAVAAEAERRSRS